LIFLLKRHQTKTRCRWMLLILLRPVSKNNILAHNPRMLRETFYPSRALPWKRNIRNMQLFQTCLSRWILRLLLILLSSLPTRVGRSSIGQWCNNTIYFMLKAFGAISLLCLKERHQDVIRSELLFGSLVSLPGPSENLIHVVCDM
jgi:hypothetical protein